MVEPDWRDKYREALSRLAEEDARWARVQNVLKLLIGRLCLAARGRNERLDQEIARIADVARQKLDADALEALLAPLSAAIATLDGSGDAAAPGDVAAAAASDAEMHDALGATAVLDRLALLPELKPVVNDLRSRKRDTLNIHEMAELLERVTRYATEQRTQVQREKLELENLVQQTASRLEEITSHLASELDERNAGQHDAELLNKNVTDEVAQLRLSAEGAPDLQTLRSQLTARLDAIGKHFAEFRTREETRIRSYRERVQHMRARISVLERESRSLHESLREEQRLAMIDALTGIPNRAAYDDRIEQEFKRWKRFTRPVSILAWDIDRFKAINDAYGHKAGDKVLRVVGQHLARYVRDTDFVARYGGEEFVMLLVGTGVEEARIVADKIRVELAALGFHFHDSPVAVTASCGITEFCSSDTPDIVFDRADRALYRAKQAGRNCCVVG
ncbi:MAG TPA: diguanylate cyclase [Steroidobacteraceae bacterium]|jgi:diguanylate cyclase|nr:diguanylate cyclase [Steroidobacteraceae bacterium]